MKYNNVSIIYLDMIGGISGDMFIAACSDLDPEIKNICTSLLPTISNIPSDLQVEFIDPKTSGALGTRVKVKRAAAQQHGHMSYRQIREILRNSALPASLREHAECIFEHIAVSESKVHGVSTADVHFHEVGGWDSIVDVIFAGAIIDTIGNVEWQASSVPMGKGIIHCQHGDIPAPAPATVELLRGFEVKRDQFEGERVTPTGAAILRHLQPTQKCYLPNARLIDSGSGYGTQSFNGLPNVLVCYLFEPSKREFYDQVSVIEFDIDDQAAEDLAIGLETIRDIAGVLDVIQTPVVGKKGRLASSIRVLADPEQQDKIIDICLKATSTLGVRWYTASRKKLERFNKQVTIGEQSIAVKYVKRPDGYITNKVEANDLAQTKSFAERQQIRNNVPSKNENDQ